MYSAAWVACATNAPYCKGLAGFGVGRLSIGFQVCCTKLPLGIPVHPASLVRLAGATFMILGVVLIRT
jgi:hypothetical protein